MVTYLRFRRCHDLPKVSELGLEPTLLFCFSVTFNTALVFYGTMCLKINLPCIY